MKVCLAPSRVLCNPELGGHAWVYLNWTLGLQANGCQVTWLERVPRDTPADQAVLLVRALKDRLRSIGVDIPLAVCFWAGQRDQYGSVAHSLGELCSDVYVVAKESELLLNFNYGLEADVVARFRRSVLVDIDPGLLQWWMAQHHLNVAGHDVYVTTGETVGQSHGKIPDCNLQWLYSPPVVHLASWPDMPSAVAARYGTVSNWWGEWETIDGHLFSNEKRTSFLPYLDLPDRVSVTLELALWLNEDDPDRARLHAHGWKVVDPRRECGTPAQYRSYIQSARGEFSCAKPSCLLLANAWISDRTLCYLASGKPVVVQHTGLSRLLPEREGMFRFRNAAEAAAAFETIEADYPRHARAARALAEQHFGAEKVVARLLDQVG